MKKAVNILFIIFLCASKWIYAQMDDLHGEFHERKDGVHSGNQFRTSFYNDGFFGIATFNDPTLFPGEWPINSGKSYLIDANVLVGSEVVCSDGIVRRIITEPIVFGDGNNSSGKVGPNGDPYTFLPLPGFSNPDTNKIAMNKWPWSWPDFWPDKSDDIVDPGWTGHWNGYFGKDVKNADEESYFVMDDYANREYPFYPDSTDSLRRGLGVRVSVRGFQWVDALVQDALFCLYDIENIGTVKHDKMVFGYKIGNIMGHILNTDFGNETQDDDGGYSADADLAYSWDHNGIGTGGWGPIGYFGGAFLESPGNPFDGVDNDGDANMGSGSAITEAMFQPKTVNVGDDIVLIDYTTFERTVTKMPNDTLRIQWQDQTLLIWPGKELIEEPFSSVDENLNGLIDENIGVTIGTPPNEITTYLYLGQKYKNYITGEGLDNVLIDERRDDQIDNDLDWDASHDDVGLDGVANTKDTGEGDGQPTSGVGTNLPGEPHIDKTDIDESDMLGLTSFYLYLWATLPLWDDENVWTALTPGRLDDLLEAGDTELMFGSGYFPLAPGQIERFSMGLLCGENKDDLFDNKTWVAKAYSENYNFFTAPTIPTVRAVAGDRKVTLIWDDVAEKSFDPIGGFDFEGYRIYRSTDPGWNEMRPITDGQGYQTYRKPIAQFDLDNEHEGYAPVSVKGVHFWLGSNTGLVNTWTDTTVLNGHEYYYAVTSYDHGIPDQGISPTECSKYIAVGASGIMDKGANVVLVRPEAPSSDFVPSEIVEEKWLEGKSTNARIGVDIVDPRQIKDCTYQVTFEDTLVSVEAIENIPATLNFSLTNMTTGDILLDRSTLFQTGDRLPITEGFALSFMGNAAYLDINEAKSNWSRSGIYPFSMAAFRYRTMPVKLIVGDFKIIFGEVGIDTSTAFQMGSSDLPAIPVNFTIKNVTINENVNFAFQERDAVAGQEGKFTYRTNRSTSDRIIFLTPDSSIASWQVTMISSETDTLQPGAGDTLNLFLNKPFLANDIFEFTMHAEKMDKEPAKNDLDKIKVVPNPYIVANTWESKNPYASGRGPRELHFIHLPSKCRIRIFDLSGQVVAEIERDSDMWDGTEIWDMRTKDNLDIAYGVYIYHVEAEGIGNKIGKFAVIK